MILEISYFFCSGPPLITLLTKCCDNSRWVKRWLLLLLVAARVVACPGGQADFAAQCLFGVPEACDQSVIDSSSDLPLTITAQQGTVRGEYQAEFRGEISAWQGQWRLFADSLWLNNTLPRILQARGQVHYQDPLIHLWADYAHYLPDNKQLLMTGVRYQWVGRQGRGQAKQLEQSEHLRVIQDGDFTTCPPGDRSWQVKGAKIVIDNQRQIASIWHARWLLRGVPVFYSPYWQLPITDQRRSGFLNPTIELPALSQTTMFKEKFECSLPYYWNMAPHLDATITPHYMGRRGLQWQLTGRYLLVPGLGTVAYDYLPSDRSQQLQHSRYLFHWQHQGSFKRHWHFQARHTHVSDNRYFSDLKSLYGHVTDNYATQEYQLEYRQPYWRSQLLTRNFQWFRSDLAADQPTGYRLQPQWSTEFFAPPGSVVGGDFQLFTQLSQFNSCNASKPEASRLHLAPKLQRAWQSAWGASQVSAQLLTTYYQQDNAESLGIVQGNRKTQQRLVPQYTFEHSGIWNRSLGDDGMGYQSLEPRLRYLYRPYRDHSQLANYDSLRIQPGYHSLFADQQWSGLDRINGVNQLSLGLTSRWFDCRFCERGALSLGYRLPLSRERTGIADEDNFPGNGVNSWIVSGSGLLSHRCSFHGSVQFQSLQRPLFTQTTLEYRLDDYRMIQLNGQFAAKKAIQEMTGLNSEQTSSIAQLGCTGSWLFNQRWMMVASHYYNLHNRQTLKQQLGVQYNSCCWAIGLNYQREFKSPTVTAEAKFTLHLQLQGLKPGAHDLGNHRLLKSSIFPYQPPLFLTK